MSGLGKNVARQPNLSRSSMGSRALTSVAQLRRRLSYLPDAHACHPPASNVAFEQYAVLGKYGPITDSGELVSPTFWIAS